MDILIKASYGKYIKINIDGGLEKVINNIKLVQLNSINGGYEEVDEDLEVRIIKSSWTGKVGE